MPGHTDLVRGPEGTIYEKEEGFDGSLRIEIDPTKLKFIQELNISESSSIFHVSYEGKPYVLKVVSTLATATSQAYQFLTLSSSITMETLGMPMTEFVT